ncbi:helix-turn-helix domain-containing protein [Paenibacillus roseipurpureus]|uniref:AraC family transcriptional regulator n=1 Tax=Paenibacillus roseopurpureus TaxID=2918901 RepID=A0AA96RMX8_9BACL|nr:AraC family transcriptional regulator [Paenibacillus sp. MBLB1832]WNR46804.1 AraC family transcriptional regulator [Paenibacillus sp. MBLB1832]
MFPLKKDMREDYHEFLEIHFFTPSDFEKTGNVWPIRLGTNIAKSNYHIGPRTTPYYYLIFVLEGAGTFTQNHVTYHLGKNDMFCLLPGVTHEYFTEEDHLLQKIFVAFDGKQALHLLERIGLSPQSPYRKGGLTDETNKLMWEFMNLVRDERQASDLSRLAQFYQIFDKLSIAYHSLSTQENRSLSWLQQGLDYIQIHYAEGITVERVSAYVGVERTHFTKQFKKVYGVPPMQYMQDLKMNEAKHLLVQTDYTLTEIANSVGYPDLFSFSKAFKKHLGVPPTQYRRDQAMT